MSDISGPKILRINTKKKSLKKFEYVEKVE